MPVIDGVKVACIPCIRGHRSTKCTHQAERIMIPVRKPGRPLSSCPHQKGKPCNCNNITAAIPRHGKCGCGTAEPTATHAKEVVKTEPLVSDIPPMSPTKMASFRVQKHSTPKSPSRKHSYDISILSQMDPSTINLIPSHNLTLGTNGNINHSSIPPLGFMPNFRPHFNSEGPLGSHLEYTQMLGGLDDAAINGLYENPHSSVPDLSPTGLPNSETSSHSSLSTSSTSHYTQILRSPGSLSHTKRASAGSVSCCTKGSTAIRPTHGQSEEQKQSQAGLLRYGNPIQAHNLGISALDFNSSINSRPIMQHTQQNTAYTYPTPYGSSFFEPLQYSQWQQMMSSQSQNMPPQNAYTTAPSGMETTTDIPDSYAAHQCGCGEGCQCLGCATHPFNSAMQEYVLSAMQDEHSMSPSLSNGDSNGVPNAANEASPSILPSPIAEPSPISESGSMGMNDYLFVSYCPGSPQSCPCGDDCACVGCMIHCQPGPRTPVTPP